MMKELDEKQIEEIRKPISESFLSKRPQDNLTSIKPIAISMRFNKVFGYGKWKIKVNSCEVKPHKREGWHYATASITFTVPEYNIEYDCVAGSANKDEGDAAKGAISDCMGKIASWIGIGWEIYCK